MAIDNSNPFYIPEVKKEKFFTKPVPFWSLGVALITGSLLSYGITTAIDNKRVDMASQTSGGQQASTSDFSWTQNSPSSPTDGEETFSIGEPTINHGVHLTVDSIELVDEIQMKKEYSNDKNAVLETVTPENEKAKFARVDVTISNESIEALDLSCGFGFSTALENPQGQRYKSILDIHRIPGNALCGDSVAPGFSGTVSYAYEVPDTFEFGSFTYYDPAVPDAYYEPTSIRLGNIE